MSLAENDGSHPQASVLYFPHLLPQYGSLMADCGQDFRIQLIRGSIGNRMIRAEISIPVIFGFV